MKVRFLVCLAGAYHCDNPGDVRELDDVVAQRYIDHGIVEPVIEAPVDASVVESASVAPAETAVMSSPKPRTRR